MEWIDLDSATQPAISRIEDSRHVKTLLRLADILMGATNIQSFCEELAAELAEATDASAAVLFLADAEGTLAPFAHTGPVASDVVNALTAQEGLASIVSAQDGVAVVAGGDCARFLPGAGGGGDGPSSITGMLAFPLRLGDRLVGVVVLLTTEPGGFDPAALDVVQTVGPGRIARAIHSVGATNVAIIEGERAHARARASRLLMSMADPWQRLRSMAEQLAEVAGVSRCFIFELQDGAQEIVGRSEAATPYFDDVRRALEGPVEALGLGLERVVATRQPAVLSRRDVLAGKAFAETIDAFSVLVVPLSYADQITGLVYLDEPGVSTDFGVSQVEAVESVVDVAALATHSVQIQKRIAERAAMERHRDRLSALHYVLNQARIILDETDLVETLPRSICDVLGYDRAYMYLINDGIFELSGCHFRRHEKDAEKFASRARRHPPRIGEPTVEVEVYRHGSAQVVSDPATDPRVIKQHQKLLASTSMVVVPLWGTVEVNGILIADYKYQGIEASEEDAGLLSLLGTGIGAALENVRLYGAARRDKDKLATLLDNSDDAIVILDRDRRIVAFNRASERLSGVAAAEAIGRDCQEVWHCCDEQGRELGVYNCPVASRVAGRLGEAGYTEHVVRTLDGRQIDVASTYAFVEGPDGAVDQSMEILRDLTEHKRWIRDHHIADTLQQALLPEAPPVRAGLEIGIFYQSATTQADVGGDFYDFISMPDGRLCLAIGDVCGKGIDAAYHTAMTKYTLRAYILEGAAPATVMARLNDTVHAQVKPGEFISMCFGLLDLERRSFTYVNAGHPRPLLLRGSEGWRSLETSGTVLGVVPGQWYDEETISLGPGDTLLFYTDGLVETRKGSDIFGEERLMQFLQRCRVTTAQQLAERIYQRSATFSGGHLLDDVAVVVVRV